MLKQVHPVHVIQTYFFKIQSNIILPSTSRCKIWPPTLREEHGLRVFENRELRRIFVPKMVEVRLEKTA
jgi:hypothetical protein